MFLKTDKYACGELMQIAFFGKIPDCKKLKLYRKYPEA